MNYIYALTYVDFDNENKDVIYFKNQSEKDIYFNLSSLFDSTNKKEINFEKGNLLDVTFTIQLDETSEIEKEFNFNYLIIKEIKTGNYYFYFADRPRYDNIGRMRVGCHLDIYTTYFDKLSFDGLIKRATFREFKQDGTDIIYDNDGYTHNFSVDDTYQGKKFLQHDQVIQPHIVTNEINSTIDSWLNDNVECWQYLYVDCYHQYNYKLKVGTPTDQPISVEEFLSDGISTSFGVLAMPIYKYNNHKMIIRFSSLEDPDNPQQIDVPLKDSAIDEFRQYNNENAYVYSSKLSKQPPFTPYQSNITPSDPMRFLCNVSVENGNLIFDFGNVSSINDVQLLQVNTKAHWINIDLTDQTNNNCMLSYLYQTKRFYNYNVSSVIQTYIKTRMTKTYYLDESKNDYWKHPNATSLKNIELKMTYNGQEYSTSPTKIDTGNAIIELLEIISPDLSKTYVRWKATGDYTFRYGNDKTLTGGVFSDDVSIPLGTSDLQQTLANSKNFFLQKQVNVGANFLLGLGSSVAKQDVAGALKGMAKTQLDEVNYGFEVDNIENAPSHLQKASGNALFNLLTKDYGVHLEIWMMTMEDLTNIKDYYNRFGESTNTIGNILDILEKHKYFDYTEFEIWKVNGVISNEIKDLFKKTLKRGVRFWYSNLYNYSKYNYERSLE